MATTNTVTDWLNTGSNILNAAAPFLKLGGSIYNNINTKDAISSGFDKYKGYADKSLDTLKTTYNEGKQALSPYLQAGTNGLTRYQSLLNDPSQITTNPGYQFEFNQGKEAVNTSAGTGRMLNSGNRLLALDQFGQDYASTGFDKALNRELPMVQAGQNATGQQVDLGKNYSYGVGEINNALGNAASGAAIGESAANNKFVTDLLGLTEGGSNPLTDAAKTVSGAGSLISAVNGAKNLLTGGAAAAGAVPAETFGVPAGTTTGVSGATPIANTPTGAANLATGGSNVLTGSQAAAEMAAASNSLPAWYTAGATPAQTFGVPAGTTTGIGGSSVTGATNANSLLTNPTAGGGSVAALFGPVAMIGVAKLIDSLRGGSVESAKSGKLGDQLQKDMQADPTGQTAYNTMEKLVTNKLWPNEGNQWVIRDLIKAGTLPLTMPALYSDKSVYDPFSKTLPMEEGGLGSFAKTAGLNAQQTAELTTTWNAYTAARNKAEYAANGDSGSGAAFAQSKADAAKAKYEALVKSYEPQRVANAQQIYSQIKASGYTGDLSKLEQYLGVK